jgi:hypothetical protein
VETGSADVDGVVTRVNSAADFSLGGWHIVATATTRYEGG